MRFYIWILIVLSLTSSAQVKFGGGFEFLSSGNGHGSFLSPHLSVDKGKNSFISGLMMKGGTIRGVKVTWSRNLSNEDRDPIQLNAMSYLQYIRPTEISKSLAISESMIWSGNGVNYNLVKVSTVEFGCGIELRIDIDDWVFIRNFVGFGFYYHPQYVKMDHERIATTLQLGTGISFVIDK